ncbi:MAG: hypothetical protein GF364_07925, partial [Candidatus Lokiarchaeota archaeon]|nr:hypothetical protein [Candidatus Lokiarchaeota archaeon]
MEFKKYLGSIFDFILGLLVLAALVYASVEFSSDFTDTPYNIPLFIGILILYIPIAVISIINGLLGIKELRDQQKEQETAFKERSSGKLYRFLTFFYLIVLLGALICVLLSFGVYWQQILVDMDEPIFIGSVALYIGGAFWLVLMVSESYFKMNGDSLLVRKEKQKDKQVIEDRALNYRSRISKIQSYFLISILITTMFGALTVELAAPKTCFSGTGVLADYAYSLPSGAHYNASLDDSELVNQTILSAFEKALRNMTRFQRAGGFPRGATIDNSLAWSDRGKGCPLFPNEFSMQGGTALVAGVYLDMYRVEPNPVYLNFAKNAADALLAVQDEVNGGFYYDGRRFENGDGYQPHPRNKNRHAILDDNVMQSCMDYLLDIYNVTEEQKYLDAINHGFDCLFDIEKPGGGWPQRSNYPDYSYPSYVTLNDDSME